MYIYIYIYRERDISLRDGMLHNALEVSMFTELFEVAVYHA